MNEENNLLKPEIFTAARSVQVLWSELSFRQRAKYIKRIEARLASHSDAIATQISDATSKTIVDALTCEVIPSILACQWYAKNAEKVLSPKKVKTSTLIFANKRSEIHHIPLGVVGVISPWNYPFTIPFGEIIMGLMAGNAIILKVASNVSAIGSLIERTIRSAELPQGLFQVVEGGGAEVSQFFFENKVDKIFFTGSVPVGKELMAKASESLTPLSLELGGNDPMVVLDDADLERASNGACWGGFQNAGQTCGGIERIYVHEKIYDKFLDLVVRKTKALRHGTSRDFLSDIGGLTTKKQLATITSHVQEALDKGAKIAAQSTRVGPQEGLCYPATVLVNVNHKMKVMLEETFGPVICIMPFSSDAEALELANDSHLALTSSVWSQNSKRAHEFAKHIEAGVTCINDHLYTHALSETPWGGWKESGIGRTHGAQGLEEMTHVKVLNWDLLSTKRNLFWYPIDEHTYKSLKTTIRFLHPKSLKEFLVSSYQLVKFAAKRMFTSWNF